MGSAVIGCKRFPARAAGELPIAPYGVVRTSHLWLMEMSLCVRIGTIFGEGQVKSPPEKTLLIYGHSQGWNLCVSSACFHVSQFVYLFRITLQV